MLPESYFELVAAAGGRPAAAAPTRLGPRRARRRARTRSSRSSTAWCSPAGETWTPPPTARSPTPRCRGSTTNRDASERALLAAALRADLPVLAICRGCQVLNVELGGTLYQHLPDVVGNLDHRSAPMVFGDVDVATVPGSVTAAVFGPTTTVRCSHHQSIRDLGRGLVVTAHAGDGVIEAVELPSARFVLAVQWHPEEGMDQRPFDALVEAAAAYRRERSVRRSA